MYLSSILSLYLYLYVILLYVYPILYVHKMCHLFMFM